VEKGKRSHAAVAEVVTVAPPLSGTVSGGLNQRCFCLKSGEGLTG